MAELVEESLTAIVSHSALTSLCNFQLVAILPQKANAKPAKFAAKRLYAALGAAHYYYAMIVRGVL